MSLVVSDTTPLHYLILIGQVDVLPKLFGKLLVPPAVIQEMRHPKAPAEVAVWAATPPDWIEVKAPRADLHLGVGAGEDEAISLAVELGDTAVLMDDKRARAAAERYGLVVLGTLTILTLADEFNLLNFEEALRRLQATTFHIEASIIEPLLAKVRARKG